MSFSEWKEVKLENACIKITDGSHFSPKGKYEGYPMLTVKDMRDNGFDYSDCKLISEDDFNKMIKNDCVPMKDDVLVAKDGSYLKHVFKVTENKKQAVLSSIAIFRPDLGIINPDYLKYFILNPRTKSVISDNYVSGSAIPRIVLKDFKKINIMLPPLQEQKAIAHILSTLDEKIEVNNRINKTLEEMAQAIFKHWFVDFEFPNEDGEPYKSYGGEMVQSELGPIPKGWEAVEIASICNIQNGFAFRATEYVDEGVKVIRTLNIGDDGFFNNDGIVFLPRTYENEKFTKYILEEFDIGLVMVGASIGKIGMVLKNTSGGLQNQNMWRFRSNSENVSQLFLYYVVKQAQEISKNWSTGSAREFYRKDSFSKIKVILPSNYIMERFHNIAKDFFNLISNNTSETQVLKSIRDTILPKLMSGEIRVPLNNEE